jgi:hypothetical protein
MANSFAIGDREHGRRRKLMDETRGRKRAVRVDDV